MSPALACRFALREMRGGLAGFRVFLLCLALGVASVAAVGSVRTAIEAGLSDQGRAILGGDAELMLTYRRADESEMARVRDVAERVSEIVDFRSMAVATSRISGETERGLTQVKGVDDAYPLYGEVGLEPEMPLAAALVERDGRPGLVMAQALIDRIGLEIGDEVRLGTMDFELRAALAAEPDAVSAGFGLGPRIIVRTEALEGSGLLGEGTFFESSLRLKLAEGADLDALKAGFEQDAEAGGWRWRDSRNGAPGVQRFVERIATFLVLIGLAALAVGGVGISSAVRAYLTEKTETIAILKTLGAPGGGIFMIYLIQIGMLTALGVALGLLLGAGLPAVVGPLFAASLPVPALFALYWAPLVEAAVYGVLTALLFALWPLARVREVRAAALFRDAAAPAPERGRFHAGDVIAFVALLLGLIAAALTFSGAPMLAAWFLGGVAGALATLWLVSRLLSFVAARAARGRLPRGRPALRLALAAIGGTGGGTTGAALSLGLGLTVLAAIGQVDFNMRSVISEQLPERSPAYFFIDIQNDQLAAFLGEARGVEGVEEIATAPMLRGVITALDGVLAAQARETVEPGGRWVLNGDRGVSYAARPPEGAAITEGDWWPEDYAGPPLVSFSAEEGRELGLEIGDTVSVNILGRDLTATVANFREIDWRGMGINFLMILDPGAMAGAPHTHIATVHAAPAAEAALIRAVGGAFPNVTAIRVRDAIERVSAGLADIAAASRWGAGAVLITGFVVLIGAAAAGRRARTYEAAILKVLGASRARILGSFALRAGLVGAAAGIVAIGFGAAAAWGVIVFVMESPFRFDAASAVAIVAGGALASLFAGLCFAWAPLAARPAAALRARE
ncbi:MAG: FtsX-like permease family protein [Paracoccaceae bacterium]